MLKYNQKLLSIVTVCHNDLGRLNKTITSLNAYYNNIKFEHIVIDGMSDDQTLSQLEHLSSIKNFKYLSEPDRGIYDAMNKGVCLSSGRWVLFLNCGDAIALTPDQLAQNLERQVSPELSHILCYRYFTTDGKNNRVHNVRKISRERLPTCHQAMIFSTHFLSKNFFNTSYKIAADFDLYLRANGEKIFVDWEGLPLSIVEIDGVASKNPVRAYTEYLTAISKNTKGVSRALLIPSVIIRFVCVLVIKNIVPKFLFAKLRNWF